MPLDRRRGLYTGQGQDHGRSCSKPPTPRDEKVARSTTNADNDRAIDPFRARNSALRNAVSARDRRELDCANYNRPRPGEWTKSGRSGQSGRSGPREPITNHQSPITSHFSHSETHSPSRRLYSFSRGFASLIVRSSSSAAFASGIASVAKPS